MNKRQKEVIEYNLQNEADVLKAIESQYRKALADINRKIKDLQGGELTQSKIYHLQYQKTLKKQVEAILEKLHSDEYTSIQKYLNDSYTNSFVGTMYDIAGQGIPIIAPIDNNAAAKAIILDSKVKEDLYTSIGVDITKLKRTIRNEITRGIASGEMYSNIARNISQAASITMHRANTIVRTEGHRIQQAATEDARQTAVKKGAKVVKQWDATLDGATRKTHRALDGQIRETNERFEADGKSAMYPGDFGDPAEDCNCRCEALTRARAAMDEEELQTLKDRATYFGLLADGSKEFGKSKAKLTFAGFKEKYLKAVKSIELPKYDWGTIPEDQIKSYEKTFEMLSEKYPLRNNPIDWVGDFRVINGYDLKVDYYDFIDEHPNWDGVGAMFVPTSTVHGKPYIQIVRQDISVGSTESYLKDLDKIREKYGWRNNQDSFYQLVGNTESMLTHEYGHALAYDCGLYGGRNDAKEIWDIFESYTAEEIGKQLSIYATTNPNEMVAEAFVQSFNPESQSELSKKIMKMIEEARKGVK